METSTETSGEEDEGFSKVDGLWECNICEKTFTKKSHIKCHVQMHRPSQIPCPQCDHILANENSLRRHVRASHTIDNYTCEWCGKSDMTSNQFRNHKYHLKHKTKYSCVKNIVKK